MINESPGPWYELIWRRYPPPGWPFRDQSRIPRLSPFTCLLLLILIPLALLVAPLIWGSLFPSAAVATLPVGDCFSGWVAAPADDRTLQTRVRVVDCAQLHDSELIDRLDGQGDMPASVHQMCAASLAAYVGLATGQSQLLMSFATSSAAEWQQGDRTIVCIASFPAGMETGSVRDSAR